MCQTSESTKTFLVPKEQIGFDAKFYQMSFEKEAFPETKVGSSCLPDLLSQMERTETLEGRY